MPVEHSLPVPVAFVTGTLQPKPGQREEFGGGGAFAEFKCRYLLSAVLGAKSQICCPLGMFSLSYNCPATAATG